MTAGEDDWVDLLAECTRVIGETVDALEEVQSSVDGEDSIRPAGLPQLHDMVEDAAESVRIRRAEAGLAWRRGPGGHGL